MKLSKFVVYLKENRERFCEVQCWDEERCERCIFVSTLNMFLASKKYAEMHYVFENSIYKRELIYIYQTHFLKEKKDNSFICDVL